MKLDPKHWKPTFIYSDSYYVSDRGQVYSVRKKKLMSKDRDRYGYHYCVLYQDGKRITVKIHKLVAMAFIPNPENKPTIDHINGDKTDNRVSNLRWASHSENKHNPNTFDKALRTIARKLSKPVAVYRHGRLIGVFESQAVAADFTNTSQGDLSECLSGRLTAAKGYTFKRIEDASL